MTNPARNAANQSTPSFPWSIIVCGLLGVFLLIPTDKLTSGNRKPLKTDLAAEAFQTYEQLWRIHQIKTADKIAAGELKTEQEVWEFQAAGQAPARKIAFEKIAKYEADYFKEKGGWSKEAHEALLRSYSK